MNKILNFKIVGFLFLLLIGVVSLLIYLNFYKFESIFFEKKWKFIQNKVEKKNAQIIQNQDLGNIFFEKSKYNFIKISL